MVKESQQKAVSSRLPNQAEQNVPAVKALAESSQPERECVARTQQSPSLSSFRPPGPLDNVEVPLNRISCERLRIFAPPFVHVPSAEDIDRYNDIVMDDGELLPEYGSKMTQEHGELALHATLRDAAYSFAEAVGFHPPLNPLRIVLPFGNPKMQHFRILLHSLGTELVRNRDDSGKLPIHVACETNAPVEVLALLSELDPATLHLADHSGALALHECCQGNVDYSSVRYLVEQGGVGTLAARNRQGVMPLHVLCGSINPSLRTVQNLMQAFPDAMATRTYAGQYPFLIAACETASASLSVVYELVRANPHLVVSME